LPPWHYGALTTWSESEPTNAFPPRISFHFLIMTFSAEERASLCRLADILIPADGIYPSASQAEVGGEGLDWVLSVRTDLAPILKCLLAAAKNRDAMEMIDDLRKNDPQAIGALEELVPAAYFNNPGVAAQINYSGQGPRPISGESDYLENGLLQAVIDRGPIYRPTPI
jgi:hypothetical protein